MRGQTSTLIDRRPVLVPGHRGPLGPDTETQGERPVTTDDTALFAGTPSASEQAQCNALVAAHSGLEPFKDVLVGQLKAHRTKRLESDVQAEYPVAAGNMFSCSEKSQGDWSKLASMQSQGLIQYPFRVYTFDDRGSYDLADAADLTGAVTAISAAVLTERATAQAYIDATLAAADEASAVVAAAPYFSL